MKNSATFAAKYGLNDDAKHKDWLNSTARQVKTMRKVYSYGLLMSAFKSYGTSKDKHSLRDDVVKVQKQMRNDFKIDDADVLPCVSDAITSALKFKFRTDEAPCADIGRQLWGCGFFV